jgi:hypothetical protein
VTGLSNAGSPTPSSRRRDYVRAYGSARQRALHRLAKKHRGEYSALLAEERTREES